MYFKTFNLPLQLIMTIKYGCYNSWNAFVSLFKSFILRLYKAMYVVFVRDLKNVIKEVFVLLFIQLLTLFAILCS